MKVFVAVLFITAVSAFSLPAVNDVDAEWSKFKSTYGKVYKSTIEEEERKAVFADNYLFISQHNEKYALGLESYTLKVNHLADMTAAERKALKGYKRSNLENLTFEKFESNPNATLADSIDWRSKGAVTPIKDQGQCGSCWAFSTTGSLEGQYYIKHKKLESFSEQQLVDCSTENGACDGGDMGPAYDYIHRNGIANEHAYPYKGTKGSCKYSTSEKVTAVSGYVLLESGNEQKLKEATANVGPVAIAIDASKESFDFYESGVYAPSECSKTDLDHAVLVVGYGSESGKDYWLVKNSWGTDWGIKGYIKMIRNDNNHCGIATECIYPKM